MTGGNLMRSKNQEGLRLALIAHDNKKVDLIAFVQKHADRFAGFRLLATQATGKVIRDKINLDVKCFLPGPLGGDLQIGGEIASGRIDALIFLRDPLLAQPHEPDITALLRVCDVHNIPVATNLATAEILLGALRNGVGEASS
jgi:methylglyoxal synthase